MKARSQFLQHPPLVFIRDEGTMSCYFPIHCIIAMDELNRFLWGRGPKISNKSYLNLGVFYR